MITRMPKLLVVVIQLAASCLTPRAIEREPQSLKAGWRLMCHGGGCDSWDREAEKGLLMGWRLLDRVSGEGTEGQLDGGEVTKVGDESTLEGDLESAAEGVRREGGVVDVADMGLGIEGALGEAGESIQLLHLNSAYT
ncbi:hypothetical protein CYMTET_22962 [Cymbomonas tetramitiformis]|uniref:Uncharacterized protein n=1 Tax=Cymbomonas tetramitiformis TaxID=36881 RepID=A0AAE0FYR6_9CHLO|nr:hypothetical protein CYMTET_22962 [Cymbomonas tetramitiformis]